MMKAVIAGPDDDGLGERLDAHGVGVDRAEGIVNRPRLEEAGIADADVFVVTDLEQAIAIPIAKDLNPDLRVVVYAEGSLPDFVSRQTDISIDPDLLGPDAVAEELVGSD